MNKLLLVVGSIVVLGLVLFKFLSTQPLPQIKYEGVHYHAGFQVYKDNVLTDYSGFEYMRFKPCGDHQGDLSPEEEQIEKAHLHDFVPDVVHVHREGATWGDLFKNIKVEVNPIEVYVNGILLTEDFLSYPIKEYDSVVVFEGENTEIADKVALGVTKEHIEVAEQKSENCGS